KAAIRLVSTSGVFPGFLQRHVALEARDLVEEEDALRLVDLVQRDAGGEAFEARRLGATLGIHELDHRPHRALEVDPHARQRHRALLVFRGLGRDLDDARVVERQTVHRPGCRPEHDDRRHLADMGGCEAIGLGGTGRLGEASADFGHRGVDLGLELGALRQPLVRIGDETAQNSPPSPKRKPALLPGTPLSPGARRPTLDGGRGAPAPLPPLPVSPKPASGPVPLSVKALSATPITEVARFGPVPGLKASAMAAPPASACTPVLGSIQTCDMPAGMLNGVGGLPFKAFCMNSVKTGTARSPPVASLPRLLGLS